MLWFGFHTLNNEELQQFKKFSDGYKNYIVDEFNEYLPVKIWQRYRKRKKFKGQTLTVGLGRGEA